MLSEENKQKIVFSGLYKHEPDARKCYGSDLYHCKNWTFKPHEYQGKVFMNDTYWSSGDGLSYELADENMGEFKFVFDFNKVNRISDDEHDEYDEKDVYRVATNSGGYSCGKLYWVNKDAKKSKELLIKKKQDEINSLKRKLEWAENDLKQLEDGTHYNLK